MSGQQPSGNQPFTGAAADSAPTPVVRLTPAYPRMLEGNGGTAEMMFTASLSAAAAATVTVGYGTSDGTAVAGSDYLATSGTLTFAPGEVSATFAVPILGDAVYENDEAFFATLNSASGATLASDGGALAIATIVNDDPLPLPVVHLTPAFPSVLEGNSGTADLTFTVSLSAVADTTVTVGYGTADGSATAGSDYLATSGTLTFAPGELSKSFAVPVLGDTVFENGETFFAVLGSVSGATLTGNGGSQAIATIVNDDATFSPSTFAIAAIDADKAEGNAGSTPFTFSVTRGGDAAGAGTVVWATYGLGANPVNAADFAGGVVPGGTLSFAAGETSKTITVNIAGDTLAEADERFQVVLSNATGGASIATASAAARVVNDDVNLFVVSTTGSHVEGNSGATPFLFTVTRTGNLSGSSTAEWYVNGALPVTVGASDFVGGVVPTGTVSFAPGETTKVITVDVQGDTVVEPDEWFQVGLRHGSPGVTLTGSTALAKVVNDDSMLSIVGTDVVKPEGNSGATPFVFTVTRGGSAAGTNTVAWTASATGPTAASASDLVGGVMPSGVLTFAPGVVDQTITVNVAGDTVWEQDEYFKVVLSGPSGGAYLGASQVVATIQNDDVSSSIVSIVAADATKLEGNTGLTPFTFTITRGGETNTVQSVTWAVAGSGPSPAGGDFFGVASHVVTFGVGEVSKTITVEVIGDPYVEPDEGFAVTLSHATPGLTIAVPSASGTILNDDTGVNITATDAAKPEGNSGSTPFVFTVSRTGYLAQVSTVYWGVAVDTPNAQANADFVGGQAPNGRLTFAAGEVSQTITVEVAGDTQVEADEVFHVGLYSPSAGTRVGTAVAYGTIENDDAPTRSLAIAATDADKAEGNGGTTPFFFTVTRSGDLSAASTVSWAVAGLTPDAVDAADFVGGVMPSGTLGFGIGQASRVIQVNIAGDRLAEPDEHFHVTLRNPDVGTAITTDDAVGTVRNDDTNFAIASTTGSRPEGNSGTTPFLFTVTRTGDLSGSNEVGYVMVGVGPNAPGPSDFVGGVGTEGTLSFAPGEVSQVITVNVQGDAYLEPNELFAVALRQPTGGATVPEAGRTALAVIVNDDTSLTLTPANATRLEGNSGATPFTFTVTRGGNLAGTNTVNWQVSGALPDTVGGSDFVGGTGPTGTLTFLPTETSKTITVNVQGDTRVEPDEHFSVLLLGASGGATILTNHATGTILNDDGTAPAANGAALTQVAAADFTGDGVTDLLRQSGGGAFYLLDGSTAAMSALSIPVTAARFVAAADFSGDGRADILLRGGAGALYDWTMDGASVRSVDLLRWLTPNQSVAGTADYTGDGRADILLHDSSAGAADPWLLLQPGVGGAAPIAYSAWPAAG